MAIDDVQENLAHIRSLPLPGLQLLFEATIPAASRPLDNYRSTLNDDDHTITLKLCLLCWSVSNEIFPKPICPREFQLRASIAAIKKHDCIVDVGTGYGKTLCTILPHLLLPFSISVVVSPLKRLQVLQVDEFRRWGLSTIAINEDTPDTEEVWNVSRGHLIDILLSFLSPDFCLLRIYTISSITSLSSHLSNYKKSMGILLHSFAICMTPNGLIKYRVPPSMNPT
jgi:hypothetical protein